MKVFTRRSTENWDHFSWLDEADVFQPHVSSQTSSDDDTQQHHDLLPPGLLLVLKGLLCVVGGPGGVLHRALHVRIDPKIDIYRNKNPWIDKFRFYRLTISPWFSIRTEISMNISCNSLIDCSNLINISCLGKKKGFQKKDKASNLIPLTSVQCHWVSASVGPRLPLSGCARSAWLRRHPVIITNQTDCYQ